MTPSPSAPATPILWSPGSHTAQPGLSGRSTAGAGHWRAVARAKAGQMSGYRRAGGGRWAALAAHESGRPAAGKGRVRMPFGAAIAPEVRAIDTT